MQDPHIPGALFGHFGPLPSVTYFDGQIEAWPPEAGVPRPTEEEQATILLAYQLGPVADQLAAATKGADVDVTLRADTVIAQLRKMNTAEFNVWWAANVTTLPQALGVLKKLTLLTLRRL